MRTIDFDIPEGSIVSLIGPNGAGKTTFFNVIAGLLEPSEGTISFAGEPVVSRPRRTWAEPFFWFAFPVVFGVFAAVSIAARLEIGGELLVLVSIGLLIGSLIVAIIRPPWYVHLLQRAGIFRSARPNEMVRFGIGRTFQNIRLFANMSALENVQVGMHSRMDATPFDAAFRLPGTTARRRPRSRRPASGSPTWGSRAATRSRPATSRTATSDGSRSPGRWPATRGCSCSTSRPPG